MIHSIVTLFKFPNRMEWHAKAALAFTLLLQSQNPAPKWETYLGTIWLSLEVFGAPLCPVNEAISESFTGIYFPQYCSCGWCVGGSLFSDGRWNLPVWLLSLLLFSWITGQVRDKLWAQCQFPFHLHCMFFSAKVMIKLLRTRHTNIAK